MSASNTAFWTKRKILTYSLLLTIIIILSVLTIIFILKINFIDVFQQLFNSLSHGGLNILWFILLLVLPFYKSLSYFLMVYFHIKKINIRFRWYQWAQYCFILVFLTSVTPFSIGAEPFIIFWLNKNKVPAKEASAMVLSSTIVAQLAIICITWPSFIYVSTMYSSLASTPNGLLGYWFGLVGMVIDMLGVTVFIVLGMSVNVHYWLAYIFNLCKKYIKLSYVDKSTLKLQYQKEGDFQLLFLSKLKNYPAMIIIFTYSLSYQVFCYLAVYLSLLLLSSNNGVPFTLADIYNYSNIAITANNFMPVPGSEGTIQLLMQTLIKAGSQGLSLGDINLLNNSLFIWRFFSFYLPTLIGLSCLFSQISILSYHHFQNKHIKGINDLP